MLSFKLQAARKASRQLRAPLGASSIVDEEAPVREVGPGDADPVLPAEGRETRPGLDDLVELSDFSIERSGQNESSDGAPPGVGEDLNASSVERGGGEGARTRLPKSPRNLKAGHWRLTHPFPTRQLSRMLLIRFLDFQWTNLAMSRADSLLSLIIVFGLRNFSNEVCLSRETRLLGIGIAEGLLTSRRILFLTLDFNDFNLAIWSASRMSNSCFEPSRRISRSFRQRSQDGGDGGELLSLNKAIRAVLLCHPRVWYLRRRCCRAPIVGDFVIGRRVDRAMIFCGYTIHPRWKLVHRLVVNRDSKFTNFVEFRTHKVIYRRYAGLFFSLCVDITDNELAYLECIYLFVEILDNFFSNVCELNLVFNFHKVYLILDEFILAGELQETSKRCA
ncbi:hypothetical protein Bca52824_048240 [Brassica carinata]|uniref:AP complex mu/sigma subunit domain-containing protein n=1 Tax=Brassica carinata TaxID=52824 RepID=A0A8X7UU35_BRACI|nr:hypothetical protein Bca52824_048240 [Brassica carinata]